VALTVSDNGTGMDAETQQHLFEPFFTTKPEGKGTGLGLALVYGIVQQSGGYILVQSTLLVGSTFIVLLPVTQEAVVAAPAIVTPLQSRRGTESVLIVEEDDVVRKMVAGIFTADGYQVTALKSFAELAREPKPARPYQLFIGTIAGEGERTARRLLEIYPSLRLLSTNHHEVKSPVSWLAPERQSVLNKPFALNDLLRAARALLDA
jgi:signal transduction histidine kinase